MTGPLSMDRLAAGNKKCERAAVCFAVRSLA
jgi:hypothetical protein